MISRHTNSSSLLADSINTALREQTQLVGKVVFLTVYAFILAFLFLPAEMVDSNSDIGSSLKTIYVISEDEHKKVTMARAIAMEKIKRKRILQGLTSTFVSQDPDCFCVDIALFLRNLSYQAYRKLYSASLCVCVYVCMYMILYFCLLLKVHYITCSMSY